MKVMTSDDQEINVSDRDLSKQSLGNDGLSLLGKWWRQVRHRPYTYFTTESDPNVDLVLISMRNPAPYTAINMYLLSYALANIKLSILVS